ncbi:hypothetical protein THASP1DRAFT_27445 [Thamnocephalis sphaerospora]|uniref:Pentacotripeptide-repeat region of PRORP domain-containing protein n=1 Tax=Thamnocephalis sphaerospora TaxID=78915 RepID=A0A4P9XWN1_9FUNG|nr:hypothetical protein THASP1DRAFT_27445 [Thamnocephalis sphaerospora]|eukprot:RKP10793.1 hypothetical protein THASP1DRAFT_27445 [Thamnocephalis sphaerospora]
MIAALAARSPTAACRLVPLRAATGLYSVLERALKTSAVTYGPSYRNTDSSGRRSAERNRPPRPVLDDSVERALGLRPRQKQQKQRPKQQQQQKRSSQQQGRRPGYAEKQKPTYMMDPYLLVEKLKRLTNRGQLDEAAQLLRSAPQTAQSAVAWSELIKAFGKEGKGLKAWQLFNGMKKFGHKPTDQTYTNLLNALASSAGAHADLTERILRGLAEQTERGKDVWSLPGFDYLNHISMQHANAAVKVYAKAGDLERLEATYAHLKKYGRVDAVTVTTVINAYTFACNYERAWEIWSVDVPRTRVPVDAQLVQAVMRSCKAAENPQQLPRIFGIAETWLNLGETLRQPEVEQTPYRTKKGSRLPPSPPPDTVAPTPGIMDVLMASCARSGNASTGYRYFCRALDRYWATGEYQPDMRNFVSATGLMVQSMRKLDSNAAGKQR